MLPPPWQSQTTEGSMKMQGQGQPCHLSGSEQKELCRQTIGSEKWFSLRFVLFCLLHAFPWQRLDTSSQLSYFNNHRLQTTAAESWETLVGSFIIRRIGQNLTMQHTYIYRQGETRFGVTFIHIMVETFLVTSGDNRLSVQLYCWNVRCEIWGRIL